MSWSARVSLLCCLLVVLCFQNSSSISLSLSNPLVSSLEELWQDVALRAAEVTVKAVSAQTGTTMSLRDVHMDTFRVQLGRQHHIGLEIDGTNYELILGSEQDGPKEGEREEESKQALPGKTSAASSRELASSSPSSSPSRSPAPPLPSPISASLVEQRWQQLRQQHTLLPDITLAGPLEFILPDNTHISAYLPNVAEVGSSRRIFISEGATVMIRGLKAVSLRYPLELPPLPTQYLAEVHASLQGVPDPSFNSALAVLYMSQQLFKAASNSSKLLKRPLLSFEAHASPAGVSIVAASEQPGGVAPRLKAKKLKDGTLEFSTRPGQVELQDVRPPAGLLSRPSAWPLPQLDMSLWLPYEAVLRGLLAQHPFNTETLTKKGTIPLRLTKCKVAGVKRLQFDMEVLGQLKPEFARPADLEEMAGEEEAPPLEIWEVVVEVDTKSDGELKFTPLTAKQKASYQDTISISPLTIRLQTLGNHSLPLGYESHSLGLAETAGGP